MTIPGPLLNPGTKSPLPVATATKKRALQLQSMVRGCAVRTSVGEGVAVGDALRTQTDPHLT